MAGDADSLGPGELKQRACVVLAGVRDAGGDAVEAQAEAATAPRRLRPCSPWGFVSPPR
jgi:hypothetical protein